MTSLVPNSLIMTIQSLYSTSLPLISISPTTSVSTPQSQVSSNENNENNETIIPSQVC